MKITIPENLKADLPQTSWGKVLAATPVIMTIVATLLAGLASSEMTRAQYDRSLAAQEQSKAGDQWNYFQAKRLRSGLQQNTLDIVRNTADIHPLDAAALIKLEPALDGPAGRQMISALQKGEVPAVPAGLRLDERVKAAIEAVGDSKPDAEVSHLLGQVSLNTLDECLKAAAGQVRALDAATRPITQMLDRLDTLFAAGQASGDTALRRDFTAARLRYTALRYDAEARLNQNIANIYELQVRKSNLSAERHHQRSQRFFFGMLAAQAGVIIATFAIAAKKRNLLWSIAAGAGLAAISFAVYIFFFV
jgi:hypothetical protein